MREKYRHVQIRQQANKLTHLSENPEMQNDTQSGSSVSGSRTCLTMCENQSSLMSRFTLAKAQEVNSFHKSFPEYAPTPLVHLEHLGAELGLRGFYVKDESKRFGLNAFKVLGGSYAIGNVIARRLGRKLRELPYEKLTGSEVKEALGDITFVTATDGNHGRGVAWTANRLGQKSVVYMPKGTAAERLENIRALGSNASIIDGNYDDAVRLAAADAAAYGWELIQDTAQDGYEEVPTWIMEGYLSMAYEAYMQLGTVRPTHIFLQAGVGSMAGAVAAFFTNVFPGEQKPRIIIVEPNEADCIFRTAQANDGRLHFVTGEMHSMMAGLCCGEPCSIAWDILKNCAEDCVTIPEQTAADGMVALAEGTGGDPKVVSGESGASTAGLVVNLMKAQAPAQRQREEKPERERTEECPKQRESEKNAECRIAEKLSELRQAEGLAELRVKLGLNSDSVVLCFSTEGDTDRENYRRIVEGQKNQVTKYRKIQN